jgi:hypothetical protein
MVENNHGVMRDIIGAYKQGRPLIWFIECDGVLISGGVEAASEAPGSDMLAPLRSLSELGRVLVAVGGTAAAAELQQLIPLRNLVFAGYSGSDLTMGDRQLGHSGVPLARRMIENIGTWIKSDLSAFHSARVTVDPLSINIDTQLSDQAEIDQIRAIVTRVVDKFRATVRFNESDRSLNVVWVLACKSNDVVESLLNQYPNESPLICCVAQHAWMNDALRAAQSRDGKTIGVEAEPGVTAGHSLADRNEFASFLTDIVREIHSEGHGRN